MYMQNVEKYELLLHGNNKVQKNKIINTIIIAQPISNP